MKKIAYVLLATLMGAAVSVRAEGVAAGLKIGTLGPGVEAVAYLTPKLNLRGAFNYIGFSFDGSVEGIDYEADFDLSSFEALLDIHPFENGFRITGGAVFNDSKADLTGTTDDDTIDIGDEEYPTAAVGSLVGTAKYDHIAPYIGIGYGNAVADNVDLTFSFDLGVMFQFEPDISLEATGPIKDNPAFQTELAKEEDDAQDFADKLKIYPVLSFGICYYFW